MGLCREPGNLTARSARLSLSAQRAVSAIAPAASVTTNGASEFRTLCSKDPLSAVPES